MLVALATLVPLLPSLAYLVASALAALLAAAGAEARALRAVRLRAERQPVAVLPLAREARLALGLSSTARFPLRLAVRQPWPLLVEASHAAREALLRPGETLRLDWAVRGVTRGRERLSPPWVALHRWGLAERVAAVGEDGELAVLPDLKAVGELHAKLNRFALRGMGGRMAARVGKGREFDRLREYRTGDEARDVAWKASARRGKLIVREHRLDRAQDVVISIDCGHRMEARVERLSKLDHAINATLTLGYLCNRMEDRCAALAFSTEVRFGVAPGRGSTHLRRLTEFAASLRGGYLHTDYLALATELRRRLRRRSLVVIMTALAELEHEPLLRALRMLAPQHLALVVVLTDPALRGAAELLPADEPELARTLAARDLAGLREQAVREARRLGALVVEADPGDTGARAMNAYIDVKRRQLL